VWTAIAWLVGFFIFFNSFTLPNSQPPTSRIDVWRYVPIQLLNLVDPPDAENAPPSGWRYLPQRLDAIAVAAFVLIGACAAGRLLLRVLRVDSPLTRLERFVFSAGLGLAALSLLTLGSGLAGMLNRWLLGGVLVAAVIAEVAIRAFRRDGGTPSGLPADDAGRLKWICLLTAVPFLLAIALGAMLPSFDFDVKEYHLQGPKEYFQNGRIAFLPHNVYTSFPFLTEMLSLLGMVLRDDWERGALAGKAVLASFAPLTALGLYAAGRRWFGATAGCLAALFFITTPWTYRISIIAYAEGGLTFFLFAALFAVMLGIRGRRSEVGETTHHSPLTTHDARLFLLAGLFAGSAMACKYPGVVQVVIPLGLAAAFFPRFVLSSRSEWWKHGLRYGTAFALGTAITVGPWLLKNAVETGNPVYPLLWSAFGGRDWDAETNAKWKAGHSPDNYAPSDAAEKFIDVVAKSDWQSPLLFAFAPLAFFVGRIANPSSSVGRIRNPSYGTAVRLWLYIAFLFAAWWGLTHRIDRFWVPMIPVVALLAGVGAAWCAQRAAGFAVTVVLVGATVVYNLAFITTALCGYNAYLIDYDAAAKQVAEFEPGLTFLNRRLPRDAKVLCVGEAAVLYARRPVVYNTVFDRSIFEEWFAGEPGASATGDRPLRPADEIRERLKAAGITHVYVNWQEVLRYRRTYGYTEFVTPRRFAELLEMGVFGPPLTDGERTAHTPWDALSADERREVLRWGPSLRTEYRDTAAFRKFQVFPVSKR
jgi:4-amino-4-deoxy-L-arabinose transferase-like glycosyltransferase